MTDDANGGVPSEREILEAARLHFRRAAEDFSWVTERLRAGELVDPGESQKFAKSYHAATQLLLELYGKYDDELRHKLGEAHSYAIDLDAARSEVGRLLDRLRAAGGSGDVPERAE